MAIAVTYLLYQPIYEILFVFIPMAVTWLILFFGSFIISFGLSSLWWIHYIKIWWRLLSWEGRPLCSIFYNPNPTKLDRSWNTPFSTRKGKRKFFDGCSMAFQANYDIWRQRTIAMNKRIISIQDWSEDRFLEYPLICALLFWIYLTILFGFLVFYFLIRILRYKFGYLDLEDLSRRHSPCKKVPCQFQPHHLPTRRIHTYRKSRWKRNIRRPSARQKKRSTVNLIEILSPVAFTTVLNIDDCVNNLERDLATWDTDSSSMVCDNSANVHICNDRRMFVGDLSPVSNHKVATIGGKGHQPSGIRTACWSWRDDKGKLHEYHVEDILYFPQSPINTLSVTTFAKQLKDTEGTGIDTKQLYSRIYWNFNQHLLLIQHKRISLEF